MLPSAGTPLLRVLIADQHLIFAQALENLLATVAQTVGIALNGRDAIEKTRSTSPDLVLLGLIMPEIGGIEVAREISRISPRSKIIILTELSQPAFIRTAFSVGAKGYFSKHANTGELQQAIQRVMAGQVYISPSIQPRMADSMSARKEPDPYGDLTPRQMEVLKLIAEGRSRKEMAFILDISIKTVEYHKASLLDRLGIRTTAELTRYAVCSGLV
jgi:DNA-binding NarL/FixJ family response regulator